MNILIVEDTHFKLEQIKEFLTASFSGIEIFEKHSYNSGLREIVLNNVYDLIILDMSLPNYDISQNENGGDFIPLAGELILGQLSRRNINTKVIVVTMYESFVDGTLLSELDVRIKREHPENYLGYVYFSAANDSWKNNLKNLLPIQND